MATKVIVQDVSALASYAGNIKKLKSDLELNITFPNRWTIEKPRSHAD